MKRKDNVNSIASSSELLTYIQLKDLQPICFDVRSSQLNFEFSPCEIAVLLLAFDILSSKGAKGARNGRKLWKLAMHRIGCFSLGKLVNIVVLWLRYVRAYESLLLLVGYSDENLFKITVARMIRDKKFSIWVRHQWDLVLEIEKELPVEAVARARCIGRHRAALHLQRRDSDSMANGHTMFLTTILGLLSFLQNVIYGIFHSIIHFFFFLRSLLGQRPKVDRLSILSGIVSDKSFSQHCFSLNLGEIFITLFPIKGKSELHTHLSHLSVLSFCLHVNALCLTYLVDITAQSLSLACGDFKIHSSSLLVPPMKSNSKVEPRNSTDNDMKTIIWSEPAPQLYRSKKVVDSSNFTGRDWVLLLENCLGQLWSNWESNRKKLQGNKIQFSEQPFLLCEIKSFLMDPYLNRSNYGLLKCSLTVGKLNFELEYLSIISAALLIKQIQDACCWTVKIGGTKVLSHSSSIIEARAEVKWEDHYESYANGLKMTMLSVLPEKIIQVGVAIAGPHIRISMQGEGQPGSKEQVLKYNVAQGRGNYFLTIDLENIEIAVWPTSRAGEQRAADPGHPGVRSEIRKRHPVSFDMTDNEEAAEHLWLRDPQFIDIKADSSENYICQGQIGLDACLTINGINAFSEDSKEGQQSQVIGPMSLTIQSSSRRDYLRSFTTIVNALSIALKGMATGATVFSYMNELQDIFQLLEGIVFAVSYAFVSIDASGDAYFQELFTSKDMPSTEKGININMVASKILESTQFIINATLEMKSLDIFLHSFSEKHFLANRGKATGASSSSAYSEFMAMTSNKTMIDGLDSGIGVSAQRSCVRISWKDGVVELLFDLSGFQSIIFKYQSQTGKCTDEPGVRNPLYQSFHCLYDFFVSNCAFRICVAPHGDSSQEPVGHQLLTASTPEPATSCCLLINIEIHEIFMAEPCLKNILIGAHQPNMLQCSVSVGREFYTVACEIQGGLVVLETEALSTFAQLFTSYLLYITDLSSHISSGKQSEKVEYLMVLGKNVAKPSDHPTEEYVQDAVSADSQLETRNTSLENKWKLPEVLLIRLSKFSLVLAVAIGSDKSWELIFEADFHLKLELLDSRRNFLFDVSRLTIQSQHLFRSSDQTSTDISVPRFISDTGDDFSSSQKYFSKESGSSGLNLSNHGSYILECMVASVMVEKAVPWGEVGPLLLQNDWAGSGSFSGLDLTITLSEIEMLLVLIAPLSWASIGNTGPELGKEFVSRNQGQNDSSEETIPDGAVVAIKDLHQHMYFAVEAIENKYRLVGTIHYSLVGERSLFRVRYDKRRRWRSTNPLFSLISLHAKNDKGEPLRLNCRPQSAFVDISSTDDRGWALWRISSYKPDSYASDNDVEISNRSTRKAFYLLNQKNNYAVAFVDGLPEFVKKPGNPFKLKVFNHFSPPRDIGRPDVSRIYSGDTRETSIGGNLRVDNEGIIRQPNNLPHIIISFDVVNLTILHEVSKENRKFQLLWGSIDNFQFIVQILSSKTRVISTLTAVIKYFDARRNLWSELISPVEVCMFYHSRFLFQASEITQQDLPSHFHLWMRQVGISLTDLSLDILLFVVGKLNLAGPYAVRSSKIFANCCKVENHSGLTLLCQFDGNQDEIIDREQSSAIFLRSLALRDRPTENAGMVSVQLAALGAFSTSPIHISLFDARVIAWRTRVVSLQDSRTFPGPFVVVDISKKDEEGVSLVVSPLLRIHNESGFSIELRFRRPHEAEAESASVLLRDGDTIDDSMAVFDALDLSGGSKKALISLSLGNFLLSVRPEITEHFENHGKLVSVDWSEDLKGGKAIRLSGIIDQLNYKFKKAFGSDSVKSSFSTIYCPLSLDGLHFMNLHFLIKTIRRDVPIMQPHNFGETSEKTSPVAIQEQKEIFLFPTVQVTNLLQSEICVLLTESDPDLSTTLGSDEMGKQAIIPFGSSAYLYPNPAIIFFSVTLTAFNSKCKPVNSGDLVKKLNKMKSDAHYLDIELEFGGGKYFASLRLSRRESGILEARIFTSYTLQNDTNLSLFCFSSNQKPLSRAEADKYSSNLPPELGCILLPKSNKSWFLKSNKVCLKWLEEKASEALLDLDSLSGFTELYLEAQDDAGVKRVAKLGVSLKPCLPNVVVPSQIVSMIPRYVISNESEEAIIVHQCFLEDAMDEIVAINSQQKEALYLRAATQKIREISFFDSMLRKHINVNEDSLTFIRFCFKEIGWSWSGPICIASLGRFFLKFKRPSVPLGYQSNPIIGAENKLIRYADVHIVEEASSLVLHFHMPPNYTLPYRIENRLCDASITYYQKDSEQPEILGSGNSIEYVWDDLTLPHKLVVQRTDMNLSREINIDKVCPWKPLSKVRQTRGLSFHFPLDKKIGDEIRNFDGSYGTEMLKVGYEVYADGPTRVLRICERADSRKELKVIHPCLKIQFRVSYFYVQILENTKQDVDESEASIYSTLIVARLGNISLDSIFTDNHKINQIRVQSLNVDEKWQGAPFAAMLRRSQLDYDGMNENILYIAFILHSTNSNVRQVKHSSIVLQPIDLNLDEETLMRLVPFWRTSLADSSTQSQQYYFKHFEIHPIKIIASFLPGNPNSNYSSAQETLRSLLHGVIKIPAIKNKAVELNGVLLTHALVTTRELFIKCAQHYSWYAMRAVYIAKGSPLLPPAFASIFDDSASSSLDVFFDPSSGLVNLPGLTIGTFKLISKCINTKGFSGTKRYFGDLGKSMKTAGSNVIFAAMTEISDSVLKGAETSGFNGMVNGFHQGILKLAMEPSLLGTAVLEGGPDRKIKLDRSAGVDEHYIEGYLQAMLDVIYKQEYLRVRVIDDQVILKNLPPNSSIINEIVERVNRFLVSKSLLKGEPSMTNRPLRHLRGESEWKIGPTVLTLCEHLFVSYVIRMLRKQVGKFITRIKWKGRSGGNDKGMEIVLSSSNTLIQKWGIGKFVVTGLVAYLDGRLCRSIPNVIARRIVSGFLLSFLDKDDKE
ncbi:vacuolar protein sorting-associated protein, putative (DUF1162) isoform X2 [Tasmannia lanceolata]